MSFRASCRLSRPSGASANHLARRAALAGAAVALVVFGLGAGPAPSAGPAEPTPLPIKQWFAEARALGLGPDAARTLVEDTLRAGAAGEPLEAILAPAVVGAPGEHAATLERLVRD